jgi:hypothetical protein
MVVFGLLVGGCATIIKGTTQLIPVSSNPAGAEITLDGVKVGLTPMKVEVPRKSDHLLVVERNGYHVESIAIVHSMGPAVVGNIFLGAGTWGLGSFVGWGIDAASGAQYNLFPSVIDLTLREKTAGADPEPPSRNSASFFLEELKKLDWMHDAKRISDEEYAKMRKSLVENFYTNPPK